MAEQKTKSRPDGQFDPRDIQAKNVSGSTAGAGSGDFHVYRQQRRIELDRIATMEKEAREKKENEELFLAAEERRIKEVNRTLKRATKRKRKKELRQLRKKLRPGVEAIQPGHIESDAVAEQNQSDEGSRDDNEQQNQSNEGSRDDNEQGKDSHNNGDALNASADVIAEKNQKRTSNIAPPNNLEVTDDIRDIDDDEFGNAPPEQGEKA